MNRTSETQVTGSHAAVTLRDALGRALSFVGDARVSRLGRLDACVRFSIGDGGDAVSLLLDRTPPTVTTTDEPAETEFRLTPDQALAFAVGRLPMPAALVVRDVEGHGDVRRYLEIDPILQTLLEQTSGLHGDGQKVRLNGGPELATPQRETLAMETRGVHKRFGSHRVLDGVDLAIPEGVISVVLGPSGTGKSVLLQHLIGLMQPDRGDVLVRGRSLGSMSRDELLLLRREVGVMFQDGALFSGMDVFDNVAFPLREHTDLEDDEIEEVVMARLREVGLEFARGRYPSELSGGMKKRAGLARALVLDPGIVLCDEPDSGLDPVRTALLADLLIEQHAGGGGSMLVVTHNIALAKRVADHISVLWQGQILMAGMAGQVLESDDPFVRQFLAGETVGPLAMA